MNLDETGAHTCLKRVFAISLLDRIVQVGTRSLLVQASQRKRAKQTEWKMLRLCEIDDCVVKT